MPAWGELLVELENSNLDELRTKYVKQLSDYTGRNTITYYSGWLKPGKTQNLDINDTDITGFMNAIKGLDCSKGLDLVLHTPGGSPTAAEGIVKYLHSKFASDVRVIVPQMAMSAGTMLSCSAKTIVMGKHSCLGPIDPQYAGTAAHNIISEFLEAKKDLDKNPDARTYWELQLNGYPPAFFYSVIDAINLSSALTTEWLVRYMFEGEDENSAKIKADRIVKTLNANNMSHSRHFSIDVCKSLGLNVTDLEEDQELQENVLSLHHAYVITLDGSSATKIIENQNGIRYITSQK